MRHVRRTPLLLTLLLFVASLLPAPRAAAQPGPSPATPLTGTLPQPPDPNSPVPPPPVTRAAPPLVLAEQATLSLAIAVTPDPLAVGATATFTLTVSNASPHAAEDLRLSLPLPDGATPDPADPAATAAGWDWAQPRLAGGTSMTVSGTLTLSSAPAGQALLLEPSVSARDVAPIRYAGGALVADAPPDDAERFAPEAVERFVPGATARLHSGEGRVTVELPAGAAARALEVRYSRRPAPGEAVPHEVAGFKRGLGAFWLTATDDQGAPVRRAADDHRRLHRRAAASARDRRTGFDAGVLRSGGRAGRAGGLGRDRFGGRSRQPDGDGAGRPFHGVPTVGRL